MRFGTVSAGESAGLIAAHTVRTPDTIVRKGRPIAAEDAARLGAAGITDLVAVRLDPGDVGEDEAAARLARRLAGAGLGVEAPFTGRCNLVALADGLLIVDGRAVEAVNALDEAITVATLAPFRPVRAGEMVATVKIIPYAVAEAPLERACAAAGEALRLAPYTRKRVGVVSTLLPGLKPATVDKTLRILADRRDVIPAGIEAAGGTVDHFGMPVDPGNLLLVGSLGAVPVIGAPGCARSPKENGFDWILDRMLAGLCVTRADIVRLGVGGLLTEITSRPQPRSGADSEDEDDAA